MNTFGHYDAPPMYSPSEEFNSTLDEKTDNPMILLPEKNEPGFAVASALRRGLQIPSRSAACTSGFEYPDELSHYGISKDHWTQFTQVVCDEAKLSRRQWTTVIGRGLGTMAVGGLMVGILGAIPAIFIARLTRNRREQRNLISAMAGARGEHLARHISQWNETVFGPRGVLIRVDLPDEYLNDMEYMDIRTSEGSARSTRKSRDKAALKARIVIIPLDGPTSTGNSDNRG
ncbi:hypothetical protein DTO027I6_7865 [Penicillium roqueforti]|uniref:uncharacterized protein n=1 Tax=Penicillium roqueforti TaxID=5082 RepID=UPI00190D73BF|nr:uncharacterized protein LCP9604111_9531 [Penicillium roqueforti]KAF9238172.1 hypothetical protein LCP9604111_9531 [Penicillium roqueforti]KAI2678836.1 hypothetical protein CBS147355_4721 [Penicillium roqueforti]KAI2709369.1 hypothetical protein CBS147318_9180 [Penicillium roqueforti]KAI3140422.1 hypothetical protein CBS147326_2123 [Penicillium roqueforti]KAI3143135.1 hypothetical protein CBS147330_922 [Penicillium roqueforti]